jgi:hypothetical protein
MMEWKKIFNKFWRTEVWEVEDRVKVSVRQGVIFLSGEYTLAELVEIVDFVSRLTSVPADADDSNHGDGSEQTSILENNVISGG